ncbi:MAG: V-type ATP synthase subunit F [Tissierellia bacterium]|nr:V-type ATP synthase subunit F [Tissierellia bacterium]
MNKVGVIGDKDSVLGFRALGLDVFTPETDMGIRKTIDRLAGEDYGVIFITEDMAARAVETISRYDYKPAPAIILIPSNQGTQNIGMDRINKNVEKALGSNIL